MNIISKITFFIAAFSLSINFGYTQQSSKSERALYSLMESGYLKAYKDYRYEVEKRGGLFKVKKDKQNAEDWVEMKNSYLRTSEAFEDFYSYYEE